MALSIEAATAVSVEILSKTRPGQSVGFKSLERITGISLSSLYEGMRILRVSGMATLKKRRGHKDGSMAVFHKNPLPVNERDVIASHVVGTKSSSSVFECSKTFTVKSGIYQARDLRILARAVLKELGEL